MRTLRRLAVPLALTLAVGPLLAGCAEAPTTPQPITDLPRPLSAAEQGVIGASNSFAFDLLREVSREQPDDNVFLSPLSASMSLGMAMAGARGTTLDAMSGTLGFGGLSQHEIDASYRSLIDLLRGLDPEVQMQLANSVWYRRGIQFDPAYFDTTSTYFDARVEGLDFDDASSVGVINDWVKEKTQGKIGSIIEGIGPLDVMFLVNAIYFKGAWTRQFDRSRTQDAPFYDASGKQQVGTVKMMHRPGPTELYRGENFLAADLPYGGGAFSMTVLVPDPGVPVDSVLASLDPDRWAAITGGFAEAADVDVYLPRFRLEYAKKLNDALGALGMGIAFGGGANFTGMAPEGGLSISNVLQKTYVDVDEEGTEAAAATSTGIDAGAYHPPVRIDRPFLVFIREHLSGTVLFAGRIMLPEGG
ncbi:MAG TPA: serpin family protein [Longimicrobiaceae bacterium]|nr:serpin family protein [Longimicrobiaceae bacterium]